MKPFLQCCSRNCTAQSGSVQIIAAVETCWRSRTVLNRSHYPGTKWRKNISTLHAQRQRCKWQLKKKTSAHLKQGGKRLDMNSGAPEGVAPPIIRSINWHENEF